MENDTEVGSWDAELESLLLRVGERFGRVEPRRRMRDYVRGLLGPVGRKRNREHEKRRRVERRTLPKPARPAVEPLNEHGTAPRGVDGAGTGRYTADQAAVVVTALVSQIYSAAAGLAGLAEHLLVLQEHRYADRP
ncbi:hypothetical protein OG930_40780 [Streptomyces sp. NBC_01799]|nr:hypothetical protein [Streptomyces sp. NBC_01800]WSA72820.1 hypothetical protein OIE65_41390 [Streptomyces sp. NBC_01800]WSA81346.1 hypothetical protein OG930_40780 [Streptomyces sp. NBC_01799]